MALNQICVDRRTRYPNLKTQLRFGQMDIELYTKQKGGETGYRFVKLEDFTDMQLVPKFNHNIKWKKYIDHPPRRVLQYKNVELQDPLSIDQDSRNVDTLKPANGQAGLMRANSNSSSSNKKKQIMETSLPSENSVSSGSDMETVDDTEKESTVEH